MSMYVVCLQTVCELGGFQMIRPPLKDKEAGVVKVYIYIYNTNKKAICMFQQGFSDVSVTLQVSQNA